MFHPQKFTPINQPKGLAHHLGGQQGRNATRCSRVGKSFQRMLLQKAIKAFSQGLSALSSAPWTEGSPTHCLPTVDTINIKKVESHHSWFPVSTGAAHTQIAPTRAMRVLAPAVEEKRQRRNATTSHTAEPRFYIAASENPPEPTTAKEADRSSGWDRCDEMIILHYILIIVISSKLLRSLRSHWGRSKCRTSTVTQDEGKGRQVCHCVCVHGCHVP